MILARDPCRPFGYGLAHPGANQQFVRAFGQFRHGGHRLERFLVHAIVFLQSAQILDLALGKRHFIGRRPIKRRNFMNVHAIEARRQLLDGLQHFDDLGMLLVGDGAGHEDAKMANVFVQQAHDGLAVCLDFLGAAVDVGDPIEGLLRRRDVVTHGRENNDRRLDRLEIEKAAGTQPGFARSKLVANEQIIDDPADFLVAYTPRAAACGLAHARCGCCRAAVACPRTAPSAGWRPRHSRPRLAKAPMALLPHQVAGDNSLCALCTRSR